MTIRWAPGIPVLVCITFTAALFGQIDSNQLRAKYGPPLARETFTVSPDFQVIVDYGPDQQVCRLELPASVPSIIGQRVDDILLELVPMSVRGKNLGTMWEFAGRASVKITEYEHVSIGEPQDPDHPGLRTGVNLVFKREECRDR
ncbi:MAG: hypothetical protein ABSG13_19985 [Bryobacteraceae bacterium]|jgi:hypothetical protein